jgi:DNA-binding transcriptional LysR family regulator
MLVESRLATLGVTPPAGLRVPYFTGAIAAVSGTRLIGVLLSRLVNQVTELGIRIAAAPEQLDDFAYGMIWHPRLDSDPLHVWFRNLVRDACLQLPDLDEVGIG